jgi:hypothetical protein
MLHELVAMERKSFRIASESTGTGEGQVSFYGLDFSHAGGGMGGWDTGDEAPMTPAPVDPGNDPSDEVDFDNPPEPPDYDSPAWWALFS